MSDLESADFFTDQSLIPDPYPYFDQLRSKCPVAPEAHHGLLAVTGHTEALAVYKDPAFSPCVSVAGPYSGLPFGPGGDDVGALIEQYRDGIPMSEHIVTEDPPDHTRTRGLLSRLLTPKRLKENEDFMWRLADQQLEEFVSGGKCEFLDAYARPFSGLLLAGLLGSPVEHHGEFCGLFSGQLVGAIDNDSLPVAHNPLEWLDDRFSRYI